jgi:acetyltransferase-like isoleucine patch superfamily enzyme
MKYENILCEELIIGKNVIIDPSAKIRGISGKAKRIVIGDNTYIGENVQIICDDFSIGDYSKIHHHTNVHGYKPCHIGHNAWIGQYSIIDSIGGTTIGNNVGIGAHSQLWSHIKFGDTLEGCRFLSDKNLIIGNDVWFVGHCIVTPITAQDKSMAMVGSVITKDMEYNTIYAGSPAKSISDKIGYQFNEISSLEKFDHFVKIYNEFGPCENIKIVMREDEVSMSDDISYFVIQTRRYKKTLSDNEVRFMKYLLPDKAKFIPIEK